MKTAVIYARYSSDKQSEQSIEGQLRVCNDFAERNDYYIVDTYIDRAMTGTNDNRTGFQQMMKDSNKKAWDCVIVYKLDRFSRNKYETAMHKKTLKDNGIKLISAMENIPDTPEGIILESLLEGMAEYYSAELAQKVSRGMNESRQKGQFTGGLIIYGYKVIDKKVYIDEDEAKIVNYIYKSYASGVYVKDIMKEFEEKGIYNRGKPFARNTIYKILKNEKYNGILRHGDEVFTNIYPPIVPEDIYSVVRHRVEESKYGKHCADVQYLLKNKVVCGYCGKSICSESGTSSTGKVNRYYKCHNKKTGANCTNKPIRKDVLENIVIETTIQQLNNKETIYFLADKIIERNNKLLADNTILNLLNTEKARITKSIDNLLECLQNGMNNASIKNKLEELESQLEVVEGNILQEKTTKKLQLTKQDIIKFIKVGLNKKPQQMIKHLIDKIIVFNNEIHIYYKYTDNKKGPDEDKHQGFSFYQNDLIIQLKPYEIKQEKLEFFTKVEAFI